MLREPLYLSRFAPAILEQQQSLIDLQKRVGIPVKDLKEINRQKFTGEAKVLRMRFGIEMNTDHTMAEVGKQYDVTREPIRQIEAKALRKLRHPSRSGCLLGFLYDN